MARLESEDESHISSLELSPAKAPVQVTTYEDQAIQYFRWKLCCGNRCLEGGLKSPHRETENSLPIEDGYLLFRKPKDEVKALIDGLKAVHDKQTDLFSFEPSEPSFDLKLVRPDRELDGLKVYVFVDEANIETGISRWDALGLRFFSNDRKLALFINELKSEFNC